MTINETVIVCPHCNKKITLDEALTHPIEEEMRKKLGSEFAKKEVELNEKFEGDRKKLEEEAVKKAKKSVDLELKDLEARVKENYTKLAKAQKKEIELTKKFDKREAELNERFEEDKKKLEAEAAKKAKKMVDSELKDLEAQVKENDTKLAEAQRKEMELKKKFDKREAELNERFEEDKKKLEEQATKKAKKAADLEIKDLEAQIKENEAKLADSQKKELEMRRKERELGDKLKNADIEIQRKLDEEKKKLKTDMAEENDLKLKDKEKIIDDLTRQIGELKNKAEQGSQQSQGEVLEMALQDVLEENFPDDRIDAISTGERGADIKQTVCLRSGNPCGCILIEAKRTKNWSKEWIKKLKNDQLMAKADISVIATAALPEGVQGFDIQEGIVIVDWRFVAPVISLLRKQLIEVARTKNLNAGRDEKKDSLYTYITSTDFRHVVESNVGVFLDMANDLKKERAIAERNWSKREKQLQQSMNNVFRMYGSMQGILGSSSLPELKQLSTDQPLLESSDKAGELVEPAVSTATDVGESLLTDEDEICVAILKQKPDLTRKQLTEVISKQKQISERQATRIVSAAIERGALTEINRSKIVITPQKTVE